MIIKTKHKLKYIKYCFCDNVDYKNKIIFFIQKNIIGMNAKLNNYLKTINYFQVFIYLCSWNIESIKLLKLLFIKKLFTAILC